MPTTAQGDVFASGQAKRLAIHIDKLYGPLDAQGTIISHYDFRHGDSSVKF